MATFVDEPGRRLWEEAKDGTSPFTQIQISVVIGGKDNIEASSESEANQTLSEVLNWAHPRDGTTPLIIASACGRVDSCTQLLQHQQLLDVNKRDKSGRTALMVAGTAEVTQAILSSPGININAVTTPVSSPPFPQTALDFAIFFKKDETRAILETHGALRACDIAGPRIYHCAKENEFSELSSLLETWRGNEGALNYCEPTDLNNTALTNACRWGSDKAIQLLAGTPGVDPNARNAQGTTALHYCAFRGDAAATKTLLSMAGVQLDIVGLASWSNNRTALAVARAYKKADVEALLVIAGAH